MECVKEIIKLKIFLSPVSHLAHPRLHSRPVQPYPIFPVPLRGIRQLNCLKNKEISLTLSVPVLIISVLTLPPPSPARPTFVRLCNHLTVFNKCPARVKKIAKCVLHTGLYFKE